MIAAACVREPVSWLRLEQLALGELREPTAGAVTEHLAACPACQACLDQIRDDRVDLPALPAAEPAALPPGEAEPTRPDNGRGPRTSVRVPWWRRRWVWGVATGLAAAAALLLVILRPPRTGPDEPTGLIIGLKGGEQVVVGLVRDRGDQIDLHPTTYRGGDRFKLVVTCGEVKNVWFDIAVFQPAADPSAPMVASYPARSPQRLLQCGNNVPLPGAFTITGTGPASVCLSLDIDHPPSREPLSRRKGVGCYNLTSE